MMKSLTVFTILVLLVGCQKKTEPSEMKAENKEAQKETLNGAGSTFAYPLFSKWAADYGKASGAQLNYQSIGSGGGVQQIDARTVDFGASDEPQTPEKLAKSKLIQFPTMVGGVVPALNVDGIEKPGELKLDSDTLCGIFLGEVKTWSDARIKKLNPDLKLPDVAITTVHRSDGSGTTAIFTHYLAEVCPDWKTKVGEGKAVQFPVGVAGKGNEGVAELVRRTSNAIGYIEFAYAKQNNMNYAQLKNGAGEFVAPSIASFQAAAASGTFDASTSFYAWLTNSKGNGSWPIAGATFVLLAKEPEKLDAGRRVIKFFDWAFKSGDNQAAGLFYVPLPAEVKSKIRDYWKTNSVQ